MFISKKLTFWEHNAFASIALQHLAANSGTNTEASTQYEYEIIDSSRAKITIHCPDIAQELEIPTSISVGQKTYTVTSISSNFRGCSKFFGNLNIPDDVTEIEGYVFFWL